jgi:hypothetical protein
MHEAILLCSVHRRVVEREEMFDHYKSFMRAWAAISIESMFGTGVAYFDEEPAPEHERAGRA